MCVGHRRHGSLVFNRTPASVPCWNTALPMVCTPAVICLPSCRLCRSECSCCFLKAGLALGWTCPSSAGPHLGPPHPCLPHCFPGSLQPLDCSSHSVLIIQGWHQPPLTHTGINKAPGRNPGEGGRWSQIHMLLLPAAVPRGGGSSPQCQHLPTEEPGPLEAQQPACRGLCTSCYGPETLPARVPVSACPANPVAPCLAAVGIGVGSS